jgi:hypothetical protein
MEQHKEPYKEIDRTLTRVIYGKCKSRKLSLIEASKKYCKK